MDQFHLQPSYQYLGLGIIRREKSVAFGQRVVLQRVPILPGLQELW